ncbi:uncharacterized protein METZ01_LOCUS189287, partial [marine metagenome]
YAEPCGNPEPTPHPVGLQRRREHHTGLSSATNFFQETALP